MTDQQISPDRTALPTGFLTFLFTDIEGSTRRWIETGDEMHDALARHDRTLRSTIEGHGGHVVKFTGDGAMAVFADADDAVAAAVDAQLAIELPVRMGLHCGTAILRDGDYHGLCVHRAARLMGAAHGGQVVVSQLVAPLLTRFQLKDLGPHRLKDMPASETIYQVLHPELRAEFPRLDTSIGANHNLTRPLSEFVGRTTEADECVERILRHRLVSIVGIGGLGKTRLATEVAWQAIEAFPGGLRLVELSPLVDAEEVVDAIRRALAGRSEPGRHDLDDLARQLRGEPFLLLLDNCDHLVDEVRPLVGSLLGMVPNLHVLTTSRTALGVDGEIVVRPDPISTDAAVELFLQRSRAAHPDGVVDDEEMAAISAICETLDGLPLAIELAAAQTLALPATAIRDRLDSALDLSSRATGGRHRTLRDTVAWSAARLDADEQELFRRLAVCRGAVPLEAIEAIAGADAHGFGPVMQQLASLIDVSLLEVASDRRRYRMLEPVRQFAAEALEASGDGDLARDRHAAWVRAAVVRWAAEVMESRIVVDADDLANIRAAVRHLLERERFSEVLELILVGRELWVMLVIEDDLEAWLHAALAGSEELPLDLRVQAIAQVAGVRANNDPTERAIDLARLAVDMAQEGDVSVDSMFLAAHNLADAYLHHDAGSELTREWCSRALEFANENPLYEMYAHSRIAIMSFNANRPEDGLASADRNVEVADRFGPHAFQQLARGFRAATRAYLGDEAGARADLDFMRDVLPGMSPTWQATIHATGAAAWERLGDEDEMVRHLIPGLAFGPDDVGEVVAATLGAAALLARRLPPELVAFGIGSLETYHSSKQPRFVDWIATARARAIGAIGADAFEAAYRSGARVPLGEAHQLLRRSLMGLDWSLPEG